MEWSGGYAHAGHVYPSSVSDTFHVEPKPKISLPLEMENFISNVKKTFETQLPRPVVCFTLNHPVLSIGIGLASIFAINSVVSFIVWRIRRRCFVHSSKKHLKYKRGTVVLHQFQRGRFAPSFSAFPLKLETYLRMIRVPYESCFEEPIGVNGICPWITFNGEDVYGAQACIDFLNCKLNVNLNKGLHDDQTAISLAMRSLIEDHLYWCVALYQWHFDTTRQINNAVHSNFLFRSFVRPMVARMIKQSAYHHGIGRHSESVVIEMGLQDLRALSRFLECKPYLMGHEATEIDAALFACLAIILYNLPFSPFAKILTGDCGNLKDYVRRMKENFWSDWDYCIAAVPATAYPQLDFLPCVGPNHQFGI